MNRLTYSDGVPAVDHHSHAGYVRPGQRLEPVSSWEIENALGHVEGHTNHDDYQEWMRLTETGHSEQANALGASLKIPQLIAESRKFQQTTVNAIAIREGSEALYGKHDAATVDRLSLEARQQDFVGLYDQALLLSGTTSVLTDIPEIDATVWPHSRYRPIARIDPYLFPFGHPDWTGRGTDAPRFRRIFSNVLARQLEIAGTELPSTLASYVEFVLESLQRRKEEGFVGLKIASAYVRTLQFERTDRASAEAAWATLSSSTDVQPAAHKALADHLAFLIAEWAVGERMPMQIHTGFGHTEPGLRISTADPLLLEEFIGDPRLNTLQIILIHGGFPYSSHLTALAQMHGNVHVDFSWMPYLQHHTMSRLLEEWLELLPANRVMFGTDTGAPEIHVASTARARRALDGVLEKGVRDGLWTMRQAGWLTERVLHRNLCDVYGIEP
ncbi:amidohydrolase family protein [Phycicoccus sp. BSK3Z-2]|uniref:Amidohydrolase family protein n=1 Tax=Phycicoccus avicenniae TaxID=2828860 RepID=A0A941D798_9MICO|nr:amidohydrolase family protein [Phycicoccus avicenniae]MBR7741827.1 amidohydrolase family protein [Phycicoccus avicenniae]